MEIKTTANVAELPSSCVLHKVTANVVWIIDTKPGVSMCTLYLNSPTGCHVTIGETKVCVSNTVMIALNINEGLLSE